MLAQLDPEFAMADHRALTDSGVTRDDWEALSRSWWELAPDILAVEFETLAEEDDLIVYFLLFTGHDTLSGGAVEVPFYVVNSGRDRFLSADLFDDRDAALACFAEQSARAGDK
jgi:hypothetical protein